MSNLEELIERLCPDGVEYKPLWSVTAWDKKFNAVDRSMQPKTYSYHVLLAKDLFAMKQETGDVFLLSTGVETGWTTEEIAGDFMCEGEVVTIPWGKSSPVKGLIKYYNGKFVTSDNRIATSLNTDVLDNKYLYYWMVNNGEAIDKFYRGSGIKHPSMYDVLTMKLPVPPLEVQREIVRILDNFTFLTAELAAELAARQKQYEYYRDLLFLSLKAEYRFIPEFAKTYIGLVTTMTQHYVKEGVKLLFNSSVKENYFDFPKMVYLDNEFAEKNSSRMHKLGDIITVHTGDVGTSAIIDETLEGSLGFATIVTRIYNQEDVLPKYVSYYLNSNENKNNIYKLIKGDRNNLNLKDFNKLRVPIPSLEQQQRIVDILDRFDALCNDISSGLPAEIEMRQKQYEYYRDKLLTFKELKKEA